ncbi:UNVERIFIED_CONTAM: hypothetical protein K2H54_037101 [Gekko kuhli]
MKICQHLFTLAGGFSEMYAVLCDYSGIPLREEIQWDVDNIYHNQGCKEFNLLDFGYLDSQDVALSVAALSFNRWFTRLYCKDVKLNVDILDQILFVLSKSVTLEELVLENCGLKVEFAHRMAQVLGNHPDFVLNTINLSGNLLEDRGIIALSQNFERLCKSLRSLSLARTSLTSKGMAALCQSLLSNGLFRTSLCHLDLSGNPGSLATDDACGLHFFLSQPNALAHLDLSGTDCALDLLFSALAGGCCESLAHLNLSKNVFSHKKNREIPPAVGKFFRKASVLQHVSLAGTKLPPEALRALLQGLARNSQLSGLHLDLSSCELRSAGAQVIEDLVLDASSIGDLNLSDNGFDSDMVTLVLAISRSRSIRHVALGKNFNIRSREALDDILHRIVQLTQDEDCSVKSLSVAESRLKLGTRILLDSLGSSSSNLVTLDISGNSMGDFGAKILAKALSMNTTLRTLIWDRNNTTVYGFLDVARALERNFTLKVMPLPVTDVAQAYRSHPEKIEELVHKIQSYLTRNQRQEAFSKKKLQLQSDSIASSSEQVVTQACQSVQQRIEMLSSVQDVEIKADILRAKEAIVDAHLALSALVQTMLDMVQSLCPKLLQKSSFRDHLIRSVPEKVLLDQLHTEVDSKQALRGVQLRNREPRRERGIKRSVAEAVARGIVEKTLEELANIRDKLAKDLLELDEELQTGNAEWSTFLERHGSLQTAAEKGFPGEEV